MDDTKIILDVNSLKMQIRNNYLKLIYPYVSLRVKVIFSLWSGFFIVFMAHCAMSIPNIIEDRYRQSILLVPFWGYISAQIPGFILSTKFNSNKLFGGSILVSSLLYLAIPVTLAYVPHLAMLIRFVQGFSEGVAIVSCYSIWVSWSPHAERTTVAPLAFSGCFAGFMLGMPFCQYFGRSVSWHYPFFYVVFLGIFWFAMWRPSVLEEPIEEEIRQDQINILYTMNWQISSMFLPIWVICTACFCILAVFQAYILTDHSSLTVEMSILFGLTPYLTMAMPIECLIATYFKKSGQVFNSQSLFYSCALGIEATLMLIAITVKHIPVATTALTIGMLFSGPIMSGFYLNTLSVIPRFATMLIGLSNIVRNVACLLIIHCHEEYNDEEVLRLWRIVFTLAVTLYICMVAIYIISVNSVRQSWTYVRLNEDNRSRNEEEYVDAEKSLVYMIHA